MNETTTIKIKYENKRTLYTAYTVVTDTHLDIVAISGVGGKFSNVSVLTCFGRQTND